MVFQLLYISKPKYEFDTSQLFNMLNKARIKNSDLMITGYMIYKPEYFMQLIEGDFNKVKNLFDKIVSDPRHEDVFVLYEKESDTRLFPDWSMGFSDMSFWKKAHVPGFDPSLDPIGLPSYTSEEHEPLLDLMQTFANNHVQTV